MTTTIFTNRSNTLQFKQLLLASMALAFMALAGPAFAQTAVLQPVVNITTIFLNTAVAVTLGIATIAVIVAGYKMMFQGASFRDVSNLLLGGAVSGGAGAIASLF